MLNSDERRPAADRPTEREKNKQEFIAVIIWSLVHVCSFDSMTTENKSVCAEHHCLIHFLIIYGPMDRRTMMAGVGL
jgi:hypothetical protein